MKDKKFSSWEDGDLRGGKRQNFSVIQKVRGSKKLFSTSGRDNRCLRNDGRLEQL